MRFADLGGDIDLDKYQSMKGHPLTNISCLIKTVVLYPVLYDILRPNETYVPLLISFFSPNVMDSTDPLSLLYLGA